MSIEFENAVNNLQLLRNAILEGDKEMEGSMAYIVTDELDRGIFGNTTANVYIENALDVEENEQAIDDLNMAIKLLTGK